MLTIFLLFLPHISYMISSDNRFHLCHFRRTTAVILLTLLLLPFNTACGREASSDYPYEFKNICDEKPRLTPADVVAVAEYAHLFKYPDGSWEVEYLPKQPNGGDPFPDHCIWKVETNIGPREQFSTAVGIVFMYIQDPTKKFWLPASCFDRHTGKWCMPKPQNIPTAP